MTPADDRLLAHQAHGYEGDTRVLETLPTYAARMDGRAVAAAVARAETAEAERDQARAALARVEALAETEAPDIRDEGSADYWRGADDAHAWWQHRVRAALTPTTGTEQQS